MPLYSEEAPPSRALIGVKIGQGIHRGTAREALDKSGELSAGLSNALSQRGLRKIGRSLRRICKIGFPGRPEILTGGEDGGGGRQGLHINGQRSQRRFGDQAVTRRARGGPQKNRSPVEGPLGKNIHGRFEQARIGGLEHRAHQDDAIGGGQGIDDPLEFVRQGAAHAGARDVARQGAQPDDLDVGEPGVRFQRPAAPSARRSASIWDVEGWETPA